MHTPFSSLHPGAAAPAGGTPPAGMAPAPRLPPALPAGHRLGGFELQQVLARSATGIVYLGIDPALDRPLAIKEYLPARLALRDPHGAVHAQEPWQEDEFARGLRAFRDETRTLARCDHASLVRVLHLLEANGTAYRVMPHHAGTRLDELRRAMNTPPGEAALRGLLDALLGALEAYHRVGGAHGAVTPANILLLADDRPLLLGPATASHAVASELVEQWLVHLKTSFAPPDAAAASASDAPAGIAADLHALAEVARFCITGVMPEDGTGEAPRETLVEWQRRAAQSAAGAQATPAARAAQSPLGISANQTPDGAAAAHTSHDPRATKSTPRYGETLLRALDAAGSARLQDWPVSVAQFRGWLAEPAPPARRPHPEPTTLPDVYLDSDAGAGRDIEAGAHGSVFDDAPRTPPVQTSPAASPREHADLAQASLAAAARAPARGTADTTLDPEWLAQRLAAARPAHRTARRARLAWLAVGALALAATALGVGSHLWQIGPPIQVDVPPQFATDGPRLRDGPGAATTGPEKLPAPGTQPRATPAATATPAPAPARDPTDAAVSVPGPTPDAAPTASVAQLDPDPLPSAAPQTSSAEKPDTETANAATAAPTPIQETPAAPAADPANRAGAAAARAPGHREASPPTVVTPPDSRAARTPSNDRAAPRAAAAPATPVAASPREACAGRTEFSLYRCMQTQCRRARWSEHAQCRRLRATDQVD